DHDTGAARAAFRHPALVRHVLGQQNLKRHGRPVSVSDDAMVHLREYDWPGNVRELENLLERLVILADEPVIRASHLPPAIRALVPERPPTPTPPRPPPPPPHPP